MDLGNISVAFAVVVRVGIFFLGYSGSCYSAFIKIVSTRNSISESGWNIGTQKEKKV